MGFQHRAYGHRPPPGSLASAAQKAVQQKLGPKPPTDEKPTLDVEALRAAAYRDAGKLDKLR